MTAAEILTGGCSDDAGLSDSEVDGLSSQEVHRPEDIDVADTAVATTVAVLGELSIDTDLFSTLGSDQSTTSSVYYQSQAQTYLALQAGAALGFGAGSTGSNINTPVAVPSDFTVGSSSDDAMSISSGSIVPKVEVVTGSNAVRKSAAVKASSRSQLPGTTSTTSAAAIESNISPNRAGRSPIRNNSANSPSPAKQKRYLQKQQQEATKEAAGARGARRARGRARYHDGYIWERK